METFTPKIEQREPEEEVDATGMIQAIVRDLSDEQKKRLDSYTSSTRKPEDLTASDEKDNNEVQSTPTLDPKTEEDEDHLPLVLTGEANY